MQSLALWPGERSSEGPVSEVEVASWYTVCRAYALISACHGAHPTSLLPPPFSS